MSDTVEEDTAKRALTPGDGDGGKKHGKTFQHQASVHENYLIYGVKDAPPIHITIVCALQVR